MKKLKTYTTVLIILGLISFWTYIFISRHVKNYLLEHKSQKTKAVIINEKNYMGNSPVSHEYTYSYSFDVNGETFKGNSDEPKLKIGDTITVRYVSSWPSINAPDDK